MRNRQEQPRQLLQRKVQVWVWLNDYVLLLKTNERRGGFWQPITGSVEDGESLEQGALREAREETGLSFKNEIPVPLDYEFEFAGKHGPAVERVFALEVSPVERLDSLSSIDKESFPRIVLDPAEHQDYRWVKIGKPEEVIRLLAFPSNQEAFRKFLKLHAEERGRS